MTKVALITGAAKGIGAATAITFAKNKYEVIINYLSDHAAATDLVDRIKQQGGSARAICADVSTDTGVKQLFAEISHHYSHLDVLINNAGQPAEPAFGQLSASSIAESIAGNVSSAILCSQAAIALLKPGSSILFTGSIYGLNFGGHPQLIVYSAGKAALVNFAQSLAESLAPAIRCNIVAPGYTKTPAWNGTSEADIRRLLAQNLQPEWIESSEIADAFLFLAQSPHITCQTIVVDGGWQKSKTI